MDKYNLLIQYFEFEYDGDLNDLISLYQNEGIDFIKSAFELNQMDNMFKMFRTLYEKNPDNFKNLPFQIVDIAGSYVDIQKYAENIEFFIDRISSDTNTFEYFFPTGLYSFIDLLEMNIGLTEKLLVLIRQSDFKTNSTHFYAGLTRISSEIKTRHKPLMKELVSIMFDKKIYPNKPKYIHTLIEFDLLPLIYKDISDTIIALNIEDCSKIYKEQPQNLTLENLIIE